MQIQLTSPIIGFFRWRFFILTKMLKITDFVVSPQRHLGLNFDSGQDNLIEQTPDTPQSFRVVNNVPVFLDRSLNSDKHEGFDYAEHYEVDAVEFDYFGEYEDEATQDENRRLHEAILKETPQSAARILDVGCGGGWVAKSLLPLKRKVVSFDIALSNCIKILARHPSPNHFAVNGDVLNLPFKEAFFDVVISAEVIEHVTDTKAYIDNLLRVTKPGGKIIISTPYNEKRQHSLCIHCNRMTPHNAHIHSFKENSLDDILASHQEAQLKTRTLSNKALLFLRGYRLLQHLPHGLWTFVDNLANRVVPKPFRLIYIITKA
ncbi:class I SAM-dependent methyltransferase [Neolewinella aurantiaca]|uniref:Class I SAM-dependent methyltransferase n=1 Tax=Neolewinella aurantiaca TaxID=2602767 RepID=A0A5C7FS97_9BACT|nr:class I SAM-dependent methyltransferase [Neolewinella aurantiaca]TXF88341.1 class I SAM-dependent methyltransferase [Neolewinella aurantiaca]